MSSKKILIADDEVHIRRSLEFVLKKEGYQTVMAENGEAALAKARQEKPALCFLDLQMPPMNGDEVCAAIKQDPETSHAHVIILTARGQATDQQRVLACGVDEYMTKPFSPSKVIQRVREVLGPKDSPGPES